MVVMEGLGRENVPRPMAGRDWKFEGRGIEGIKEDGERERVGLGKDIFGRGGGGWLVCEDWRNFNAERVQTEAPSWEWRGGIVGK